MEQPDGGRVRRHAAVRALSAVFVGLIVIAPLSASAEEDVARVRALREARDDLHEETEDANEAVDAATATIDELTAALDDINSLVRLQAMRVGDAEREVESAELAATEATDRLGEVEAEMAAMRTRIVELAVSGFTGEGAVASDDLTELAFSDQPGDAARLRHLLDVHTGTLSDGLDRLRLLEVEAISLVDERDEAVAAAEAGVEVVARRSAELDRARQDQAVLVQAAETRLEARLAEAAAIEERDAELAQQIRDEQQAINRRIAGLAATQGVEVPDPVDLDDIVTLRFPDHRPDFTIEVHVDIAEATEALFIAAFEDGLDLTGFGYRPIQTQIELRAQHCGPSDEDIWLKPVAECAPPTARPGTSKHEQGLAIDFAYNGRSVSTRDSVAFAWLAQHAPALGFVNLDIEPWHWSAG